MYLWRLKPDTLVKSALLHCCNHFDIVFYALRKYSSRGWYVIQHVSLTLRKINSIGFTETESNNHRTFPKR